MSEKRKYRRYACDIKATFEFFEGDPDTVDVTITIPSNGAGRIIDISRGGVFIASNDRVSISNIIRVSFALKKEKRTAEGIIVRTGLLRNNPSEAALRFANRKVKEDSYIAVRFTDPLPDFTDKDL
ncbi:MAG TPA: PilZ domain-containing protein [Spirochaetota bacterium]|nr:PilZ domain-containing protein [Spirochaetota bacterium]